VFLFVGSGGRGLTATQMRGSQDRIASCTTTHWDGLIAVISPETSWVARWQRTCACRDPPSCVALMRAQQNTCAGCMRRACVAACPRTSRTRSRAAGSSTARATRPSRTERAPAGFFRTPRVCSTRSLMHVTISRRCDTSTRFLLDGHRGEPPTWSADSSGKRSHQVRVGPDRPLRSHLCLRPAARPEAVGRIRVSMPVKLSSTSVFASFRQAVPARLCSIPVGGLRWLPFPCQTSARRSGLCIPPRRLVGSGLRYADGSCAMPAERPSMARGARASLSHMTWPRHPHFFRIPDTA
jgi:hypothetical protein